MKRQTSEDTYQGWSNHATWAAELYMANDEPTWAWATEGARQKLESAMLRHPGDPKAARQHAVHTTAALFQCLFEAMDKAERASIGVTNLRDVNWAEIAREWLP